MLYFSGLYNQAPLVDSDECAGLPSKQERKHLPLRRRTAGHHYPIQQNLFYRICFSVADGPLHMFSSHWSRVKGCPGCRYYIRRALRLHRVSPQTLHNGRKGECGFGGSAWEAAAEDPAGLWRCRRCTQEGRSEARFVHQFGLPSTDNASTCVLDNPNRLQAIPPNSPDTFLQLISEIILYFGFRICNRVARGIWTYTVFQ